MRKLNAFVFTTLNGFFKDAHEQISWHKHDTEESKFSEEGAQSGATLLFGRVTYDMMVSFWPTPAAMQSFPVVADGMNKAEKIVFSRTLKKSDWNNTRVINNDMVEEVKKLKQASGIGITILGSGSIISQLTDAGLIDQYQIMLDPIAIGNGTPLFNGIKNQLNLKLTDTRIFKSGVMVLTYEVARG